MNVVSSGRISLLLVCGSFSLGGSERNVVKIATGLDQGAFAVRVLSLSGDGPLRGHLESRGIPVQAVDWSFNPRCLWQNLDRLQRLVAEAAPDILHVFNYPAIYFGVAAGVQSSVPVRLVAIQAQDTWKGWIERIMDRLIRPAVSLYVADGAGARQFTIRHQGLDPTRIRLLYDGPDLDELQPSVTPAAARTRMGLRADRPVVAVVARLQDAHKGQSVFLRSLPRIPEILGGQFVLVGAGEDEEALRNLARELDVADRVTFAGSRADLGDVLAAIDILVVPSRRFESVPKILLEGMAAGRPVVATRIGDIPEFLQDGVTGLMVESEDPDALAAAIIRLLQQPELAARLGTQAREHLIQRGITLQGTLATLAGLYRELRVKVEVTPTDRMRRRMRRAMAVYRALRLGDERVRWVLGWRGRC